MATNPYVNKVVYGNSTVMDISDTDTQESDVANGKVFYKGTGARSVGTANLDSAVWGNITGTLSNQTDLQNALDAKMSYADNGVLGAKNWFKIDGIHSGSSLATITDNGKTIEVANETAGKWQMIQLYVKVLPNTKYLFTSNVTVSSGAGRVLIADSNNTQDISYTDAFTSDNNVNLEFNSGNNSRIVVKLECTDSTSETGDVTYNNNMLRLASDSDSTYQPYAMTNKELTDSKDTWSSASTVANGEVSFSGLDDTQGWGYFPCFWVDGNSTNLNPTATIKTISGAGTASMSVTYETDADNGASCRLRIEK